MKLLTLLITTVACLSFGQEIKLETALSTNWLSMNLQAPNGDGTTRNINKEVGIIISNRYAIVVADNSTNKILLSSTPIPSNKLLIRDGRDSLVRHTNTIPMFQYLKGWIVTNW